MTAALDCRHYLGDRPCVHRKLCTCDKYSPMGYRVLVIKLAALGDVVRTACLLPSLKRQHPKSHITWVSKPNGVRILRNHPLIDQLVTFDADGILSLTQQRFDLVLSLDKESGPIALCNAVQCADKRGIRMSQWGTAEPCDQAADAYMALGLDDDLKFKQNRKTYPQLVHEAVNVPYQREPYRLYFDGASAGRAAAMFAPWRAACKGPLVGLNTGCGTVFANKAPRRDRWVEIARLLQARGAGVVLLGGPEEVADNAWITTQLGGHVFNSGCENTEPQFTAVVDQCDAVITGDTLAMHVAIARDVPVVALFGPTCEQEIDLFDMGAKVISPVACGPCYRRKCDTKPDCMEQIDPRQVAQAAQQAWQLKGKPRAGAGGERGAPI